MTIPERLVAIREANGYTRKRLADELGRPYRTITNYESGDREPGHAYIIEIAQKFGVTTDYILGIVDTPTKTKKTPPITGEALEVAQAYEVAGSDIRRSVRKLLDLDVAAEIPSNRFVPRPAAARGEIDLSKESPSDFTFSGSDGTPRIP